LQLVQVAWPVEENLPAGHDVWADDPAGQKEPAGQAVVVVAVQKEPAGQAAILAAAAAAAAAASL